MAKGPEEATKVVSIERARKRTAPAPSGASRVGPKVTMTRQMEQSSAEGSKARTRFWQENSSLIKDLDSGLLDQFVADLTEDRRAMEQLLRLIKAERSGAKPAANAAADKIEAKAAPAAAKKAPAKKAAAAPTRTPAARKRAPRKTAAKKVAATPENAQEK